MERRAQYKHQSQTYNHNIYGDYGGFQQHDDKSGNNQVWDGNNNNSNNCNNGGQ